MGELKAENPKSIQEMFGRISTQYDLANSVLSFGIHRLWKKKLIKESKVRPGHHILDCATGTGDLAFLFEAKLNGSGKVIGSDFCEPMLEVGKKKILNSGKPSLVQFECADVMKLPYSDRQFDIASISFGIRNVQNPFQGLSELGRVLKPGGRALVLEFGQPRSRLISAVFGSYSKWILPKIGGLISGQPEAYHYLQESSAAFPCGEKFLDLARGTGLFSEVRCIPLQFGIAYLYVLERSHPTHLG